MVKLKKCINYDLFMKMNIDKRQNAFFELLVYETFIKFTKDGEHKDIEQVINTAKCYVFGDALKYMLFEADKYDKYYDKLDAMINYIIEDLIDVTFNRYGNVDPENVLKEILWDKDIKRLLDCTKKLNVQDYIKIVKVPIKITIV